VLFFSPEPWKKESVILKFIQNHKQVKRSKLNVSSARAAVSIESNSIKQIFSTESQET